MILNFISKETGKKKHYLDTEWLPGIKVYPCSVSHARLNDDGLLRRGSAVEVDPYDYNIVPEFDLNIPIYHCEFEEIPDQDLPPQGYVFICRDNHWNYPSFSDIPLVVCKVVTGKSKNSLGAFLSEKNAMLFASALVLTGQGEYER